MCTSSGKSSLYYKCWALRGIGFSVPYRELEFAVVLWRGGCAMADCTGLGSLCVCVFANLLLFVNRALSGICDYAEQLSKGTELRKIFVARDL